MRLNELRDNPNARKTRTRVGRGIGSGKGKTAGRGHKGQKSRSGVAIKGFEGGQMPIHRRLPKRGFRNINRVPFTELNLSKIEEMIVAKKIDPKNTINLEALLEIGVIKKISAKVKILAKGSIKSKINIEVSAVSSKAKEAIEQLGGSITLIKKKKPDNEKIKKSEV